MTSALACGGEPSADEEAPLLICAEECAAGEACIDGRCMMVAGPGEPEVSGEGNPTNGRSWTLLIYMLADNDLEHFGLIDLLEMMAAGGNDRLNIIVQVDRAEGYFSSDETLPFSEWTSTRRYRVERGELVELVDLGEQNMGDASVLGDFVAWGISEYPADRVGLILWDHGGGWSSFGGDESHDHDTLSLAEIRAGLDAAFAATGTKRLAMLGFDACLMATYEVARLMRPYAHYLMASEELEPGIGWDYRALEALRGDPSMSPEGFGRAMIPAYQDACNVQGAGGDITLSMVNLNKLSAVDAALDGLVAQVRASGDVAALLRARGAALSFGKNANPANDRHLIDIVDLTRQLAASSPSFAEAHSALEAAMRDALVTQVRGPATQQASGLSIYLPTAATYYDRAHGQLGLSGQWARFVGELSGVEIPSGERPTFTNPDHVAEVAEQQGSIILGGQLAEGTAENVAEVRLYAALVVDEAAGEVVILSDTQGAVDVGERVAAGLWEQKMLVLKQGASQSFGYISTHIQGDYLVFMIPFGYQAPGSQELALAFWTQVFNPAAGEVISSGFYALSEGGTGQLTPVAGSKLHPLALVIQGGQASWTTFGDVVFDGTQPLSSDLADVPAGSKVYFELNAKDVAGNFDYVYHVKQY